MSNAYKAMTDALSDEIDRADSMLAACADNRIDHRVADDNFAEGYALGMRHALDRAYDIVAAQERVLSPSTYYGT